MLQKSHIKIDDFGGGLITKGSPLSIQINQSPDCLNIISDSYKSLQKRLGYAKVNSGSTAAVCNGIYNYRRTDTQQYMLGLWGTALKKMDVVTGAWDGTWDAIAVDANKGTALSSNIMHNTAYSTDAIITTEGRDVPQKWDPIDAAGHTDLDWETSHAIVTGDDAWTGTFDANDLLKITLDGGAFDDIILNADTTVAEVVISINAHAGFAAQGLAYADASGYLNIVSNTRGATSTCIVEYGSNDTNGTCVDDLFDATKTIGTVVYTDGGGGSDDATVTGAYTGTDTLAYRIEIDGIGTPDTFKWSDDGGSTWDVSTVNITGSQQTLNNGIIVTFGATTGHSAGDRWDFTASVNSTADTIVANLAPSGKYNTVWQGYTWIANTLEHSDRMYRSAAGDPTSWSALEYETIVTPGDVGLTGFAILRGRMYVFKKQSIHRVTYLGGTPLLDIKELKSDSGTSSPKSIINVELPGEGEVILFFGTDLQWYKFDGRTATPISEGISTYNGISKYCMIGDSSTYGLNPEQLLQVHCVHYPRRHWCILFFCMDNDTTPKDAIVFDYYAKAFYPMHFDDVFTASCIADNGSGQRLSYVAGTNYMWLNDTGNNDDGTDINAYWTSMKIDLGSEIEMNALRNITFTTTNSVATPLVKFKTDWDSSWTDTQTLTASEEVHTYDLPRLSDLFQYYISDDSSTVAFGVIRASLVADKRGIAK